MRGTASHILNFGTGCSQVVTFIHWSLHSRVEKVCVHLVSHLFVIINYYYGFYFAVLFKVQTQRLCYVYVAWPIFTPLKPVLVFCFLATVAVIHVDPS